MPPSKQDGPPTAFLASDGLIALAVFLVVKAMNRSIPQGVSLISFHDADWTSAIAPTVTVIAQPAYELGREVIRMLLDRINGLSGPPRRCELKSKLIPRESVKRLP